MVLIALIACGLGITMAFPPSDGIANVTDRSAGPLYLGCYLDKPNPRQLEKLIYSRNDNTPKKCESTCREAGYFYFGLQWSRECFCGKTLAHSQKKSESDCYKKCTGDRSKICGGDWRNSLFKIRPKGKKQAECHKLKLRTKSWGQEISWKFGSCQSPKGYGQNIYGKYANYREYTINCCQPAGTYELDCKDRYGDGWHGGSIEIGGKQYCKDFIRGYSKKQRVQHSKRSARTGTCATVYWHWRYRGSSRTVRVGESTRWVGYHWNDKVSSLRVTPGCTFVGYEHSHYRGQRYTYTRSSYWVGSSRNDKFSSWTCRC